MEQEFQKELRDLQEHFKNQKEGWVKFGTPSQENPKRKRKRRANDFTSHHSTSSYSTVMKKPQSVKVAHNHLELKHAVSYTNSKTGDDLLTTTTSHYTQTKSAQTKENLGIKSMHGRTDLELYQNPDLQVQEESSCDSISVEGQKSAKYSTAGSTDFDGGILFNEAGSVEGNAPKKKKKKLKHHPHTNIMPQEWQEWQLNLIHPQNKNLKGFSFLNANDKNAMHLSGHRGRMTELKNKSQRSQRWVRELRQPRFDSEIELAGQQKEGQSFKISSSKMIGNSLVEQRSSTPKTKTESSSKPTKIQPENLIENLSPFSIDVEFPAIGSPGLKKTSSQFTSTNFDGQAEADKDQI